MVYVSSGWCWRWGALCWLLSDRAGGGDVIGDALALGAALMWAAIALLVRATSLSGVRPELQLFGQVLVSAVLLTAISPLFGALIRDPMPIHYAGLLFQIVCIASLGFLFWFWLISIYKAGSVASFSFLAPVFAVVLGWLLLGEQIGVQIWTALALVAIGLVLINRK